MNKNNRSEILALVQQRGTILKHASRELQNDKEIVLAAVRQEGYALVYASQTLRNDKDVVLAAIEQKPGAIVDAGEIFLRENRSIVLETLKKLNKVDNIIFEDNIKEIYKNDWEMLNVLESKTFFGQFSDNEHNNLSNTNPSPDNQSTGMSSM